jgi:hypothetical protein
MDPVAVKQTCMVLSIAGLLFFLAGASKFINMNYALFFGVASFLFAVWVTNHGKRDEQK